jgi:hypothetical protein
MRRFLLMALFSARVALPGGASDRPEERKPFSDRLVDLIAFHLGGSKTEEEFEEHWARKEKQSKDAEDDWDRARRAP